MPSMSAGRQDEPIVGPGLRGPGRDPALGRGASCSLTMTGHVPLHRAWARRPRIPGNAPAAAAAAARQLAHAAAGWGTLAWWTLMWWSSGPVPLA